MSMGETMFQKLAAVSAALLLLTLAGCASDTPTAGAGAEAVSLAQSKSPVQLLRNEAVSRLPRIIAQDVAETSDTSVACLPAEEDPDGISRSWRSSLTLVVTNSRAASINDATEGLVDSFVDQGWTATEDQREGEPVPFTLITSATSPVAIEVQQHPKTADSKASITIVTSGPCVVTDGEGSDEVLALEGVG